MRILHGRGTVGPHAQAAVEEVVAKRESGVPLAYSLGRADFAGLTFVVTPEVLIPRPDSEWLVERGNEWIKGQAKKQLYLLDLGCGSGCIGLTLSVRHPQLKATLSDVSQAALEVSSKNARRLGVIRRCEFRSGDWFSEIRRRERFDIILCNPPYVTRRDDPELEQSVKRHEPSIAVFLDEDPQEFYFRLARRAIGHLYSGGLFAVEVGYDTAWPARCAFEKVKALRRGHEIHDFAGIERVIWGIRR